MYVVAAEYREEEQLEVRMMGNPPNESFQNEFSDLVAALMIHFSSLIV
jgi:hypothetical protein